MVIRIRKLKNRQHNGQKTEEQTTQWPKDRRTDNTMAKRKSTKRQKRSTKHTDRATRTLLKTCLAGSWCLFRVERMVREDRSELRAGQYDSIHP